MKTGIELIAQERQEQIDKHGRTLSQDKEYNKDSQLQDAARGLIEEPRRARYRNIPPIGWDLSIWQKMWDKSYKERLIIAGALIAAEIDRINN